MVKRQPYNTQNSQKNYRPYLLASADVSWQPHFISWQSQMLQISWKQPYNTQKLPKNDGTLASADHLWPFIVKRQLYNIQNSQKYLLASADVSWQPHFISWQLQMLRISWNDHIYTPIHTSLPNFFRGGGIGPKWKSGRTKMKIRSENFSRKKRGSQIFRLRRAFFVVEALKTAKKPLKTAKNR